jgi:hypothetical protein
VAFNMIGVTAAFQAASFYLILPVLFVWDRLTGSGKAAAEDYKKALNIPKSTVIPLAADAAMEATPANDQALLVNESKPVNRIAKFETPGQTPGGIDLGGTKVNVNAPSGEIQMTFDDSAMLGLLLKADGLAPIIYNIQTMTPGMVSHFVGLDY